MNTRNCVYVVLCITALLVMVCWRATDCRYISAARAEQLRDSVIRGMAIGFVVGGIKRAAMLGIANFIVTVFFISAKNESAEALVSKA